MATVTITFDDAPGGEVGLLIDLKGPLDMTSPAHRMANGVLNHLDRLQAQSAPEMIHTAEAINHRRADQVKHIKSESQIILAH